MKNIYTMKMATGNRQQATGVGVRSNNKLVAVLKYLKYSLLPQAG